MPVAESDLVSAVDCMLGNVFQHTPEGTGFEVHVSPRGLTVDDAGPGIADPAKALRRGSSGAGSTGLGLDIVRRVAETAGGRLVVERSPLRGARVAIVLEPMALTPATPTTPRRPVGRSGNLSGPARPIRLPRGSVNCATTRSRPGTRSGRHRAGPAERSASCSAASTSGTPT